MKEHLTNFTIAGLSYYDAVLCFKKLKLGTALELKLEEENKYDPRAVALYYKENKLGFIPRAENRIVYKLLKIGLSAHLQCHIQQIDATTHPENQIRVVVHLVNAL